MSPQGRFLTGSTMILVASLALHFLWPTSPLQALLQVIGILAVTFLGLFLFRPLPLGTSTPQPEVPAAQFQRLVETLDLVPWEADLRTWRFTYVGPQAERLLGFPVERWYEADFWVRQVHPDDRQRAVSICQAACASRHSHEMEYRMLHATGRVVWVHDLVHVPPEADSGTIFRGCFVDITQRWEAEEAQRRSEEQFRRIFELGLIGMAITGLDKGWVHVNQEMCQILGYSREELLQKTWAELTHPDDLAADVAQFNRVLAHAIDAYSLEKRFIRSDGAVIHSSLSVHCLRRADGAVDHFVALVQDITERQQAEAAIRESEERFRSVVEGSIQGVLIHQDSIVQYANPASARILGYDGPADLLGRSWRELAAIEEHEWFERRIRTILAGSSVPFRHGWRGCRKDGSGIWIASGASPITWRGQPAVVAFFLDVTEQKQAEDALRASERRFRELFDNSPDAILVEDLSGQILDANPAAAQLHGCTVAELLGRHVSTLVSEASPESVQRELQRRAGARAILFEGVGLTADHRQIPVEVRASMVLLDRPALLLQLRDLSERRHLQQAILEGEKMEAASRVASSAAHDFNNILQAIQGCADLIRAGTPPDHPAQHDAQEIHREVGRAQELVRQLRAFKTSELGSPQQVRLGALLHNLGRLLESLLGSQNTLTIEGSADVQPIWAVPEQLERLVINLVVNARDAMPQGGQLALRTANVTLDAEHVRRFLDLKPGPHVLLQVQDTGHGMAPEVRARAFEPYFTTKPSEQGTGLGLFNVYQIVRQCRGHIEIESLPQQGTTFRIYFPALQTHPEQQQTGRLTVLVVEDDPFVRPIYRRVLEAAGYRILEAPGGPEALLLCDEHRGPIDLLLTDVLMPEINGYELAQRIVQRRPQLKVLYVTGFLDDREGHFQHLASGQGVLEKPFMPDVLLQRVRGLLAEA